MNFAHLEPLAFQEAGMDEIAVKSPLQYLDKASNALRDMGLMPEKVDPAPINALLEKISDLDQDKIALIARTLGQTEVFNEVVREQTSKMEIGERYQAITNGFNSIRDDSKRLVDQVADGKIDIFERGTNMWMKIARGDIADRFDKIKKTYLTVTKETKNQIDREGKILEAYRDYRGALKNAEVMALEVLKKAGEKLEAVKRDLKTATDAVANFAGKVGDSVGGCLEVSLDRLELLSCFLQHLKRHNFGIFEGAAIVPVCFENLTLAVNLVLRFFCHRQIRLLDLVETISNIAAGDLHPHVGAAFEDIDLAVCNLVHQALGVIAYRVEPVGDCLIAFTDFHLRGLLPHHFIEHLGLAKGARNERNLVLVEIRYFFQQGVDRGRIDFLRHETHVPKRVRRLVEILQRGLYRNFIHASLLESERFKVCEIHVWL